MEMPKKSKAELKEKLRLRKLDREIDREEKRQAKEKIKNLGFTEGFTEDLETKTFMKPDWKYKEFLQIHLPLLYPLTLYWYEGQTLKWQGEIKSLEELKNLVEMWEVAVQ